MPCLKTPIPLRRLDGGTVTVSGRTLPVEITVNARARRLILRVDGTRAVTVTCPTVRHVADARSMVEQRRGWIADRLDEAPKPIPFSIGTVIPVLGRSYRIEAAPAEAIAARIGRGTILVGGRSNAAIAARIEHLLRQEAARACSASVAKHAARAGVSIGRISVREMRSRWGSCAASGNLAFSWRLVLAPPGVLDYVAAHEVAHRRHMDHSPAFWSLVAALVPDYLRHENWLKRYGRLLHAYGERRRRSGA